MMKIFIKTAIIATVSFFLTSCNTGLEVTKRKYRKGYYVSVSSNKTKKNNNRETNSKQNIRTDSIQASVIDSPIPNYSRNEKLLPLKDNHQLVSNDSSSTKENNHRNSVPLLNKFVLAQKAKAIKKINKNLRYMKHQKGLQPAALDDDIDIDSDTMFLILLVLAIFIPPATVFMVKGKESFAFKLNLVLWLIGSVGFYLARLSLLNFVWLASVLAVVHALYVLLGHS